MSKELKKALWFGKNQPTEKQIAEIEKLGYQLCHITEMIDIAKMNTDTAEAADNQYNRFWSYFILVNPKAMFGTWTAPWLVRFHAIANVTGQHPEIEYDTIPCYATWKTHTGSHIKFVLIGQLM